MARYGILIDYRLCFACYACEVACKQENNLPVGPRWIRVITVGPRKVNGKLVMDFVPMTCMHCGKPSCIDACPVKAITKREDGIVLIDAGLCNGCGACIEACPFTAPQFNPKTNRVEKCTLCVHRVEKGLKPSCVQHCPAGAIYFGDVNQITEEARKKRAVFLTAK
jgi:Fe-S-cluster-containing dehydrogenase component